MIVNKNTKVSIIIPAYNEAKMIGECIESLAKQLYKKYETILVDDFSRDNTGFFAREAAEKFEVNLNLVKLDNHRERAVARNIGSKKASGNYLLFIDADMRLDKHVLNECIKVINKDPSVKAIVIPELSFGKGFWANCKSLEKRCYLGDEKMEAARFFEKKAFWSIGRWDNEMVSGEDWDLTKRLKMKYKIGRVEANIFHNENKLTIWQIAKKKFYYASKSQVYLKKYPLSIKDIILFVFRPAYFRNWKLFLSDPIHGAGVFILKFIEVVAGGLGFLYSKIVNRQ